MAASSAHHLTRCSCADRPREQSTRTELTRQVNRSDLLRVPKEDPNRRAGLLGWLHELHGRLLSADSSAEAELCQVVFREVRRRMRQRFPTEDDHTIDTVTEDAIMTYLRQPSRYDSDRSSLTNWLGQIAVNRLRNAQRARRRRLAHERAAGMEMSALVVPGAGLAQTEEKERWIILHESILFQAAKTPKDRALIVAKLAAAGFEAEVKALEINELPADEARNKVNRVWENLVRRARRFRLKWGKRLSR